MTESRVKRRLTALLSTDVKEYSRMMGKNKVGTYQTLDV